MARFGEGLLGAYIISTKDFLPGFVLNLGSVVPLASIGELFGIVDILPRKYHFLMSRPYVLFNFT